MPRNRSPENAWLPARVYRGKSCYEYRPASGGTIKLAPLDAPQSQVWAAWEALQEGAKVTLGNLINRFLNSTQFAGLAPRTQRDYREYAARVDAVFGHMHPSKITAPHIRKYMDKRSAKIQANRERAFMVQLFGWGLERGDVTTNVARDVKPFKEQARERYITDEEYKLIFDQAAPLVQAAMEISYLCAARISDVLKLAAQQLQDNGIYIRQGKTGKRQIKRWTPRLRSAIRLAQSQPTRLQSVFVLRDQNGQPIKLRTLQKWFAEAKTAAGLKDADIHFHDIKAKGISDYEGDKQRFSGHKTAAMVSRYDRKVEEVDTLDKE
jgi:integrase